MIFLLKALHWPVQRPPVWMMMRQAGRLFADYIRLREKYDFFTRCQYPELATEITPAAGRPGGKWTRPLFSGDILVYRRPGLEDGRRARPLLPKTIKTQADVDALLTAGVEESLHYVYAALRLTKQALNGRVPLIGFAGAPWTLLCYMVEGKGSKTWDNGQTICLHQPSSCINYSTKLP